MRLRIHRGAHEIGGNCVEIESQGYSIVLDLGLPFTADSAEPSLLPKIIDPLNEKRSALAPI
jgi:ribonuclease J